MAIVEFLETPTGNRRRFILKSPVDFSPLGEFDCANAEDIAAALARARAAQRRWARVPVRERAAAILRVRDEVYRRQDEITATVIRETGKPLAEALSMEVYAPLDLMSYYARRAERILRPRRVALHGPLKMAKKLTLTYEPLGVIGIIMPWNGPFVLSMNFATQALLAGNAVLVKGSEVTPESARLAERIYRDAGLPEDLMQVITGDGQTGAALVESGVNKISFTGSTATGRKIGEACGRLLIPCTLELGGTDAMIVCDDANLEHAADGAVMGACMNAGQVCCGSQRILVAASVYDRLVDRIAAKVSSLRQGPEQGAGEDVGAIIWDRQLAIIQRHVDDAVAKGARLLCGGRRHPALSGLYFEPTVLADCTADMLVMREETFGPVVAIRKVRDDDEALAIANDSACGLSGNVWSDNPDRAWRLASGLSTGSVTINDMAVTYGLPEAPFGGVRTSGIGRINGEDALRSYCNIKPIVSSRFASAGPVGTYPYSEKSIRATKRIMAFVWASTLGRLFQ